MNALNRLLTPLTWETSMNSKFNSDKIVRKNCYNYFLQILKNIYFSFLVSASSCETASKSSEKDPVRVDQDRGSVLRRGP